MHAFTMWAVVLLVSIAAITDLRSRRIPNWLVLPFLVLGVAAGGFSRGIGGLGQSLLGVLAATLIMGFFCFLGGMGMGDMKLCAAVGAWVGPSQLFIALVTTGLAGGIMALCWGLTGGFLNESLRGVASLIAGFARKGPRPHKTLSLSNPMARRMPYAPAIAIGVVLSFLSGNA